MRLRNLLLGLAALALPAMAQAAGAPKGDPARGEALVKTRCSICHSTVVDTTPRPAPTQKGVVGRKAGTVVNFKYSAALKASGLTWTPANLDKFLTNPAAMVPGTFMVIAVPNPAERADIIAYLATVK
ncbi:MAG TPA: c-type cytochrome [Caulobacteraceae bacterium]|jgi:cytochrome c|nr:c-type cytochrome [Caulobacteraceae bacterium]